LKAVTPAWAPRLSTDENYDEVDLISFEKSDFKEKCLNLKKMGKKNCAGPSNPISSSPTKQL
jgi:hypothetical protein